MGAYSFVSRICISFVRKGAGLSRAGRSRSESERALTLEMLESHRVIEIACSASASAIISVSCSTSEESSSPASASARGIEEPAPLAGRPCPEQAACAVLCSGCLARFFIAALPETLSVGGAAGGAINPHAVAVSALAGGRGSGASIPVLPMPAAASFGALSVSPAGHASPHTAAPSLAHAAPLCTVADCDTGCVASPCGATSLLLVYSRRQHAFSSRCPVEVGIGLASTSVTKDKPLLVRPIIRTIRWRRSCIAVRSAAAVEAQVASPRKSEAGFSSSSASVWPVSSSKPALAATTIQDGSQDTMS
mmetsp:Transcript_35287/g.80021  ORF Transcript_35287/g.80021 Transcript_35287/m.80021 type:complete len:307 (-) Transcript_35287:93-1013(-)